MLTRRFFLASIMSSAATGTAHSVAGDLPEKEKFPIYRGEEQLLDPVYRKQIVDYDILKYAGTVVVDPHSYFLYQVRGDGRAIRYGIGVGRSGFEWKGEANIMRKQRWPNWYPPSAMRKRQPYLPRMMPGGPKNPLGARALYLYQNKVDTLYRIHGTMEPETIGTSVSSGCIRMLNEHVADLYDRVPIGTQVVVL